MGMVMGMKGTVKGCGSSWNRVIVMKGTSKGCGSSADGVMGRVIGIQDLFIYLFIYCHLYSAFSIVQCSNALYRLWDGEIQGHTGQPSVREIDAHTMYNHWATAPGRSLNYPRPKSITHLRTFSDNGVYVALQLFLVILVSDQWRRVLIPYSYRQAPWGLLHARGWLSRYTWDQRLYVVSEPRETHSPMLKARFLHLTNFGSSRGSNPRPLAYQANVLPLSHGSLWITAKGMVLGMG